MIIKISDSEDERLNPFRSIRYRDPEAGFIAEGALVVTRLLQSDYSLQSLLVHAGQVDRYRGLVPDDVPVFLVDPELGKQIAGYDFHRGVLAHADCRPMAAADCFAREPAKLGLGLVGISDPENVGSLLRSAAAMGIHDIFIGPGTISPYVRRVIRVSMASVFHHRFYQLTDVANEIVPMQQQGVSFAASTLATDAVSIDQLALTMDDSVVLLVGNEATGLSMEVQQACRHRVTLPMASGTDSLNVGVAGAIFMHELSKQV